MADDQRLNEQMDQLLNHPCIAHATICDCDVVVQFAARFGIWIGVRFGGNYFGLCHCSNPCADRIHPNPRRLGDTIDRTD